MGFDVELFGNRLRQLREGRGFSTTRLGNLAEIDQGTISKYENGLREPGASNIYSLAKVLKVSADYLIGLED